MLLLKRNTHSNLIRIRVYEMFVKRVQNDLAPFEMHYCLLLYPMFK